MGMGVRGTRLALLGVVVSVVLGIGLLYLWDHIRTATEPGALDWTVVPPGTMVPERLGAP
jgi:hypothetical protein